MTTQVASPVSLSRVLEEGYGKGAWHGPDMKAALADVSPKLAFWRPAPGRHSIAEIALHHAFCVRAVRAKLSPAPAEPFLVAMEDWFELSEDGGPSWSEIEKTVEAEQRRLAAVVEKLEADAERFDLVLGITCHAVYHAGQVQLVKRLHAGA